VERGDPARNVLLIGGGVLIALLVLPGVLMGIVAAAMGLGVMNPFSGAIPVGMAGMGVLMSLFWVVVIVVGVALGLSLLGRGTTRAAPTEDEFAVLRRRYAAGEIGKDEYERIRGDLTRDRAS
jgi:uncharacterized membrane protein